MRAPALGGWAAAAFGHCRGRGRVRELGLQGMRVTFTAAERTRTPSQHAAAGCTNALGSPPAPHHVARQVNKSLETEREFAKKLGQQAAATKTELQAAIKAGSELGAQNAALQGDLKARPAALSTVLSQRPTQPACAARRAAPRPACLERSGNPGLHAALCAQRSALRMARAAKSTVLSWLLPWLGCCTRQRAVQIFFEVSL